MKKLTLCYPKLENIQKEVKSEFDAYIDSITILGSLRTHLKNIKIDCFLELKLWKKDGTHKTPDFLIKSANYIIVDHKYTKSDDRKTLTGKIDDMNEYDTVFIHKNPETKNDIEFSPEVVMLTPECVLKHFKQFLNCPTTWGYTLDSEILINQGISAVKDPRIASLFKPSLTFPVSEEISKYKFFISHAPLPYTACQIYNILFTLTPPTQFFKKEFEVKFDDILEIFNNLFPPWVRREIKQLNVNRLSDSLDFLRRVGWIKWYKPEKIVIVDKKKGRQVGDLMIYLIDKYVKELHDKRVKKYQDEIKKQEALKKPKPQKSIIDFL